MFHRFTGILLVLLPLLGAAQRFGGTPPSVKWRQIETDTARIIFPAGLDSQALQVATLVHREAAEKQVKLGNRTEQINIVLQNLTTTANGYVGMGPYRSEFYLTPSADNFSLGSLPWAGQLSLHEYRHVQQFNNFNNGLSKLMRTLFGQEGYALAVDAAVPNWFFEGDAVYNETVLSGQGRGRLPLFMNAYPSLWRAHKDYSWMKLRNGSLKDYVPDHYNLGYLLVNYGYGKYGEEFWSEVMHDASAYKGLFYPMQQAIERHAGISYQQFRKDAFDSYKASVPADTGMEAGPAPVYPLNKKVLTNYLFPYAVDEESTVYLKTSNNRRPAFVLADKTGEHWIRNRDLSGDEQFSYRNGKIVYAGFERDPRWTWRDYSVIKIVDIDTRRSRTITHKTRYFTPDISPNGQRIAAVELSADGHSEIHIMDDKGKVSSRISSGETAVFTDPKFINDDSLVTAVRLKDGRMALAVANLQTGSVVRLTNPSFNVIGFPCIDSGVIYFTASYNGSDQVFAIRPGEPSMYQLTSWPLGNYFVNVAHGKMRWSAFTADGYQLQQLGTEQLSWKKMDQPVPSAMAERYGVNSFAVHTIPLGDSLALRSFATRRYPKGTRLFNFHSWRPYYEDPEFTFSLYGENILNTFQTQLYYVYNENDRTHGAGVNAIYAGLFPYLSAGSQLTFDRRTMIGQAGQQSRPVFWNQLDTRVGVNVPLNWAKGQTYRTLNIGTDYVYRKDYYKGVYRDSFALRGFSYLSHFISYGQQVQMAPQHIYPRLGYTVSANYQHVTGNFKSWQYLGNATIYLPGFFASHSLVIRGSFQETDTLNSVFGNSMAYSRGYNAAYFSRMWRLSGNYHFPIVYPDWGLGNILYLQRVRANAFYDLTRVYAANKAATADQRSFGGELYVDTKWWNQYELTFGLRVSHTLDPDFYTGRSGVNRFEFIVPVSIFPR